MTMEEVASLGNLRRAFERVESNDGAPGPDRQSVREVREHLEQILPTLRRTLLDGSYCPGMIRRVWIPKAGGGERGLGIPNVVDRIVQQAVHQVLSLHYEPTFHPSSHGFRPGRSCHTAVAEAGKHLKAGYEWVVDLDLEKFFDRVHHDRLMARLAQRIEDRLLLRLIRQMLTAKVVMPDGVVVATEEGTPQGGPLSPLLSNIVLDELDWELEERGHRFVRYADDSNIYVCSERAGHRVMATVVRFIERRLRLKVNAGKSAVARPEERHFVGFRLRRTRETAEVEVLPSKRSIDRLAEKIRGLTPRNWGQSFDSCISRTNGYLRGWIGFFGICSATTEVVRTLRTMDAHLRRRLRALLLRQWKRKRFIVRHLVRMGARPDTAWRVVYEGHKSLWALSHCGPVDYTLSKFYFEQRGLLSLEILYRGQPRFVVAQEQLTLDLDSRGRKRRRRNKGSSSPTPRAPKSRM
jgi:group II intron reverse transcriptase/maturase